MENSCDVLVANGLVVVPRVGTIQTDIMIEDGRIKSLKASANASASRRIDATGKYVIPGAIDPHVHYGVYTPIEEAAITESRSAAVGGITTMFRMLRLYGDYSKDLDSQLHASASSHHVDYSIHASILKPDQVQNVPDLASRGINSFKIYMNLGSSLNRIYMDLDPGEKAVKEGTVEMTDNLVEKIVQAGSSSNSTVLVHAESHEQCSDLVTKGAAAGAQGLKAWSDCRPPASEAESIAKVSEMARRHRANLYFVHIGSNQALDAIVSERERGYANYHIETCPQYLTHTFDFESLTGKVVPPLRSKTDVQGMWYALRNGIIDTIGTDHVANRLEQKLGKGDTWSALAGFPGLATMLPVLMDLGVHKDRIGMDRLVEVTSYNAARIFELYPRKGTIQPGSDADITIIDAELEQKVTPELLQSYSDYTIYDGWKLRGWPIMTLVRGTVVMEKGQVSPDSVGHGRFQSRPVTPS